MFSSPSSAFAASDRPTTPSSVLSIKRKAGANEEHSSGRSSPAGFGSPARKHPRLPALNLPRRSSFAPSSSTIGSSCAFGGAFSAPATASDQAAFFTSSEPSAGTGDGHLGGMDVDDSGSSSEEGDLRTPVYPHNLAWPFGTAAIPAGSGDMTVDKQPPSVGLLGPSDFGTGVHGPNCRSIPKVVLSHPNPAGESTLWSVCRDCGATSAC